MKQKIYPPGWTKENVQYYRIAMKRLNKILQEQEALLKNKQLFNSNKEKICATPINHGNLLKN